MSSVRDLIIDIGIQADSSPIAETQRRLRELQRQIGGYQNTQTRANTQIIRSNQQVIQESQVVNRQLGAQSNVIRQLARTSGQSMIQMANGWNNMSQEMRRTLVRNHNNLQRYERDLMSIENNMLNLSNQMGHYTGTTSDFMREVQRMGADHKRVSDQMINSNIALRATYVQQAATMLNLSTTSSKINRIYAESGNALYQVNRPLLAVTDGMERLARSGDPVVVALRQLGPNASMKALQDRINLINTGIMRQQALVMAMGVAWLGFTAIMANAALGPDPAEVRAEQAQITQIYRETMAERVQTIKNFASIFEDVATPKINPKKLVANLQEQVIIMRNWGNNLRTLAARGVDQGLIQELQKMGPSAANEIQALTKLSDSNLNQYVDLWRQKHKLAVTQATSELAKLKEQTNQKIKELQDSLKPLGVAWEKFKGTWANALAPFVDIWGQMAAHVVNAGTKVGEFVQKLNEISPWITKLAGMFAYLFTTFMVILSPLAIGIGLFGGLQVAFSALWAVIGPFVIGFASVAGTAAVVSLAIIGVAAAIYLLWNRSETFRNAVISGWESIKQAAVNVWGAIQPVIMQAVGAIVSFVQQKLNQLRVFWDENGTQILQAGKNVWTVISTVIKSVLDGIWAAMKFVWPAVLFLVKSVWANIKGAIDGGLKVILGLVKFFSSLFTGDFRGMWEATKQIFFGAIQFIWNFVQLTFFGRLLGAGKIFIASFRSGFVAMWTAIRNAFMAGVNGVRNFFVNGFNWLRNFSNNIVTSMTTGIANRFLHMVNQARTIFSMLRQLGENIFRALWNTLRSIVSNIVSNVRTGFATMKNRAVELATDMKDAVMNRFTDIVNAAKKLPGRIGDGLKAMAKGAMSGVKALANTLATGLETVLNKITQDGINKVLDKLGVDKKYQIPKLDIPAYANGTKGHSGGLALLGDGRGSNAGPELYRTPRGDVGLSPATNTIMNLPKGTQVLSATDTRKVLSGMPAYNSGNTTVGDFMSGVGNAVKDKVATAATKAKDFAFDVWEYASDPSMLMNKVFDTLNLKVPDVSGVFGQIASGAVTKLKDGAIGYVKSKIGSLLDFGGGFTGGMEKDPHKVGRGAGMGGMMRYVEYWYNQIKDRFGPTHFMGGFNDRNVRGGNSKSMHAYGRAFDVGGSHATMSKIAEYLRTTASNLQYVIYNHRIAGPGQGKPWRAYDGINPHTDHVHADFKAVSTVGGGVAPNIKGGAAAWRAKIIEAAARMNEAVTPAQVEGIIAQIHRESKGDQRIFQSPAVNDINMRNGNPARGLLQYIPSTFRDYMVKGHTDILNGMHQLLAFFNNTNWRKDLPYGRRGWGPTGSRKYKNGTNFHPGGPAVVGDGWKRELIRLPGGISYLSPSVPTALNMPRGSSVLSGDKTVRALNSATGSTENTYNPQPTSAGMEKSISVTFAPEINVTVEGNGADKSQQEAAMRELIRKVMQEQWDGNFMRLLTQLGLTEEGT